MRKEPLVQDNYYHIFNRSIAQFRIFDNAKVLDRFVQMLNLYRFTDFDYRYSEFSKLTRINQEVVIEKLKKSGEKYIEIIAYCLMPTHFHLILKQIIRSGIRDYMAKVLNSYSRYFNLLHGRKGPLWEGHFRNVLIKTDEQILHLTRYIHLNPVSAGLVSKPEDWRYSSYSGFINRANDKICLQSVLDVTPQRYLKFVNDQIGYQKELSIIKSILIDDYTS